MSSKWLKNAIARLNQVIKPGDSIIEKCPVGHFHRSICHLCQLTF